MEQSDHKSKTLAIFNTEVEKRTALLDKRLAEGTYYRGYFFREAVKREVSPRASILDYGCGSGRIAKLLSLEGYEVTGMDPAEKLIQKAKEMELEHVSIQFHVLEDDGEHLINSSYDAIVCSSAIEFIPQPDIVLHNLCRALRPGGKAIISFSNPDSWWKYYAKWRFGTKYDHFSVQKTSLPYHKVTEMMLSAGFNSVSAPIYFESAFDRFPLLRPLNRLPVVGTLFLVVALK